MPPTATLLMVYAAGMVLAGLMYVALSMATRSLPIVPNGKYYLVR